MEEVATLAELAIAPSLEVGTRVLVREYGYVYISVGNTLPEIRSRLGWTQDNVWMPDHVERGCIITSDSYLANTPRTTWEAPMAVKASFDQYRDGMAYLDL